jgi:uncharacterized membrane protein
MNTLPISDTSGTAFPEKTLLERIAEFVAIGALTTSLAFIYYYWNQLPGQIPVHFSFSGDPDRWGDKMVLLAVVFVQAVIYLLMTFFSSRPSVYSLPLWLYEQERVTMRSFLRKMLILLKAEVMAMLTFIIWTMVHVAIGSGQALSVVYMILFITIILCTVAWFAVRYFRVSR